MHQMSITNVDRARRRACLRDRLASYLQPAETSLAMLVSVAPMLQLNQCPTVRSCFDARISYTHRHRGVRIYHSVKSVRVPTYRDETLPLRADVIVYMVQVHRDAELVCMMNRYAVLPMQSRVCSPLRSCL